MLDMKFIRENAEAVKKNAENKRMAVDIDGLLETDARRLDVLREVEALRKERNETAEKMKSASADERPALIARGKEIKELLVAKEGEQGVLETKWKEELLKVPNMTHPDSPIGASDDDNLVVAEVGKVVRPDFKPLSHVELAAKHDLIDFERASKVTGAKFYFLKGQLAILEQALIVWAMKELSAEGYTAMSTPDLARDEVLLGTGFNPRGPETQIYSIENTDLSLVGTAEITLGGYHKDEILDEAELPLKYAGVSHCYRTEAGAYGKESYGLYRVHQFSKVEMFIFCAPNQSEALHAELRRLEERIFQKLGIPYQVVDICTGDLGGPAYRKYDLEGWMWGRGEGKGGYGEITSTSNCTDYQARRLNVRVKRKDGSLEYAHTLNGTAVSLARALITILENHQQADGSIKIPDVLVPYTGFDTIG
ncbi:serine--tRNA ligase [Patescibacteria group bacterium]|jgi:seryl-tRNA synthetase|nr:serine--tRNA ligase [Patescibacteria group bacterium]